MNKANNHITFRLQSDLDGSLGVEHAKDFMLSMAITDHIESHVDAFRSFLLAAAFPQTLVDKALQKEVVIQWGPHFELATALEKELAEAKDLISELQEANDQLSKFNQRSVPSHGRDRTGAVRCPHRTIGSCSKPRCIALGSCEYDEIKPGRIMSDAGGEAAINALRNTPDLYTHDSLLEPMPFAVVRAPKDLPETMCKWEQPADFRLAPPLPASIPAEAIAADKLLCPKPPTQTLNVTGIDAGAFGKLGKANGVDAEVAARLNKLVSDPQFQQYTIEATQSKYEEVLDAVKLCVEFVQKRAFRPSFDASQPIKFALDLFNDMNEDFANWAKEKGITLE